MKTKEEILIEIENIEGFIQKAEYNSLMFGKHTSFGMQYENSAMRWRYKLQEIKKQLYTISNNKK